MCVKVQGANLTRIRSKALAVIRFTEDQIHNAAMIYDTKQNGILPIFMAQDPQMPSLQERLKVREGSISFLILMSASKTMGPQLFRSTCPQLPFKPSIQKHGILVRKSCPPPPALPTVRRYLLLAHNFEIFFPY